jgi:hypothetical protein
MHLLAKSGPGSLGSGLLAAILCLGLPAVSEATGSWQGQVVDAETGQPLADVAVLGVWHRRVTGHPAFFLGRTGIVGAAETTTDATGRFTLSPRFFVSRIGIGIGTEIDEPELGLFRAGYGGWRFRDPAAWFTGRNGVIEMRPLLSTPDERRKYLEGRWTREERDRLRMGWRHADRPANWIELPHREARGYEAAINRDRAALGLGPIGIGYPHLRTK